MNKNYALIYKKILIVSLLFVTVNTIMAQHTFSIVAVDPVTGEIGSAGATCLDIDDLNGEEGALVISDIIRGVGGIHTQAAFTFQSQAQARARMEAGDSPQQILNWIMANDPGYNSRQYGIVDLIGGPGGTPRVVGFTGSSNGSVANHIVGSNYAIAGNILISQDVLDDMETGFLNTSGTLADKLMGALQGAKRIGAQTSCSSNQTSSKSAFLRVAKVEDLYTNYGHLTVDLNVSKTNFAEDPIDVLQTTYDFYLNNPGFTCNNTVTSYPFTESFESGLGLWEQNDVDLSHVGNTDFDWIRDSGGTPTSNTGPSNASDGTFYLYTEATGANVGNPTKRAVLNSPCLNLSSIPEIPTLSFDYHMFGANIGNLAVRVNDGTGWKTIWLLNGAQGNQWNAAEISLIDYVGQTIQIRMDSTTGVGAGGDVAIDNISVYSDGLLSVDDVNQGTIGIYPNPTSDKVNITMSNNATISKLEVYDILGKKLISKQVPQGATTYSLSMQAFQNGIYIIKAYNNESIVKLKKIIVSK